MKTSAVLASMLFGSIAAAAPFDKRALVYKTEVVTETVVVYTTVYDDELPVAQATTTPAGYFYEQPKAPSSAAAQPTSQAPAPAPVAEKPSSTYVAPAPAAPTVEQPKPVVNTPTPVAEAPKPVETKEAAPTSTYDTDMIVALSKETWGQSTYDVMTGEATNPWCGQRIKVEYNGNHIFAKIMDMCPGCAGADIDLSLAAWKELTKLDEKTRLKASWSKA